MITLKSIPGQRLEEADDIPAALEKAIRILWDNPEEDIVHLSNDGLSLRIVNRTDAINWARREFLREYKCLCERYRMGVSGEDFKEPVLHMFAKQELFQKQFVSHLSLVTRVNRQH